MKRYLSVFEMIARSSIYKVLLAILGMVVAEAGFFYYTMINTTSLNIEEYIDQSYYSIIFRVAYTLITILIILPGMNIGSVQSYTLQRLRIKEDRIFWLQTLYNMFAYILLWGAQFVVILISIIVYQKNLPEGAIMTNQTIFVAFYRNAFMHSILPLEDGPSWWLLVMIVTGTALAAAEFTRIQRCSKFGFELCVMVVATLVSFPRAIAVQYTFFILAFCSVCMVIGVRWLLGKLDAGGE